MRPLIFIAMLFSGLVGIAYPGWVSEQSGQPVAISPLFKLSNGFRDATVNLDAGTGPVQLYVEAEITLPMVGAEEISLYAVHENRPVFVSSAKIINSPQRWRAMNETRISVLAGSFMVAKSGSYTFRAALKGSSGRALDSVRLLIKPQSSLALLHELTVFDRASAFKPVEIDLDGKTKPLLVSIEANASQAGLGERGITIRSSADSPEEFASTVKFSTLTDASLAGTPARLAASSGILAVDKPGTYRFEAAPNGPDTIRFEQIDLVLRPEAVVADKRVRTIAFGIAALLLVLFHFSQYLPARATTTPSGLPPQGRPGKPKWGRSAADR